MPTSSQFKVLNTLKFGTSVITEDDEIPPSQDDIVEENGFDLGNGEQKPHCGPQVEHCLKSNSSKHMHTSLLKLTCDLNNFTSFTETVDASGASIDTDKTGSEKQEVDGRDALTNVSDTLHKLGFRDIARKSVYGVRRLKKVVTQYK